MKKNLNIFIFADALGWKLARERRILEDLLPFRNRCETLLGYSSTCDPTILTGKTPQEHGHFSFFVKAENLHKSPFGFLKYFSWLPHRIAGYHRIRNRLSRYYARKLGYTGYFQLYSVPFKYLPWLDYTEKRDIYEPGGILGGQETIFETWKRSGKKWFRSDWRKGDTKNFEEASERIAAGEVELIYLFTAGLDAVMHRHGTSGPEVDRAFRQFEERVHAIHNLANEHYGKVNLHLFSDHGMADVTKGSDMMVRWFQLPLKYGVDYIAVWDSTMARFWFHNDRTRKTGLDWLKEQVDGRLLEREDLQRWHCEFSDNRYGEYFYLLPSGSLFVPSFLNLSLVKGMHGYAPEDETSAACWLTNNPEAKAETLMDIYPVMKQAVGQGRIL